LTVLMLAGCASPRIVTVEKPIPPRENCISVPGEGCKKFTAGNVGGTTLGNREDEDLPLKAAPPQR